MIAAFVQARMSSTRLPGKIAKSIIGKPMLHLQIERMRRSRLVDELVVLTSKEASDDATAELAEAAGVPCFRGALTDVLDRFYQAALMRGADTIVRLTGDCPLIDWTAIDGSIELYVEGRYDYVQVSEDCGWPKGLDVEVMSFGALERAHYEATTEYQREHVTPFIYQHPQQFKLGEYSCINDLSTHRWTVDTAEDLDFVQVIYGALYPNKPGFTTNDILAYLAQNPTKARLRSAN
ncbi:MAG: glycosyltransferase family protein [Pseudomonadota bacterium]